ncbi:hypothetical protein AMTRI_Chr06g192440 [Amborella trichopoda]
MGEFGRSKKRTQEKTDEKQMGDFGRSRKRTQEKTDDIERSRQRKKASSLSMQEQLGTVCYLSDALPDELVEKILLLLPVDSLVRMKRVSQSWNRLISSPSFAEYYYISSESRYGSSSPGEVHSRSPSPREKYLIANFLSGSCSPGEVRSCSASPSASASPR